MQNCRDIFNKASVFCISGKKLILHPISVQLFQVNWWSWGAKMCYIPEALSKLLNLYIIHTICGSAFLTHEKNDRRSREFSTKTTKILKLGSVSPRGNQYMSFAFCLGFRTPTKTLGPSERKWAPRGSWLFVKMAHKCRYSFSVITVLMTCDYDAFQEVCISKYRKTPSVRKENWSITVTEIQPWRKLF